MTQHETRELLIPFEISEINGTMPPHSNLVLIQVTADTSKTKSGIILPSKEWDFSAAKHAERVGIVTCFNPSLLFLKKNEQATPNAMLWKTKCEIEVGDVVLFDALNALNALSLKCNGVIYKFIAYSALLAKKSEDGTITPLNGYCFFKEIKNSVKYISREVVEVDRKHAIVSHIGTPNEDYFKTGRSDDGIDIKVGDKVLFKKDYYTKYRAFLEYEMHAEFSKEPLLIAQRHWIDHVY